MSVLEFTEVLALQLINNCHDDLDIKDNIQINCHLWIQKVHLHQKIMTSMDLKNIITYKMTVYHINLFRIVKK